jgi:hypothetical protein
MPGPGRKFTKGRPSPNPGGRPKTVGRVRELANTQTEGAIATLVAIMRDPQQPAAARVAAAKELLDLTSGALNPHSTTPR